MACGLLLVITAACHAGLRKRKPGSRSTTEKL
jgi:hypothetical protein